MSEWADIQSILLFKLKSTFTSKNEPEKKTATCVVSVKNIKSNVILWMFLDAKNPENYSCNFVLAIERREKTVDLYCFSKKKKKKNKFAKFFSLHFVLFKIFLVQFMAFVLHTWLVGFEVIVYNFNFFFVSSVCILVKSKHLSEIKETEFCKYL